MAGETKTEIAKLLLENNMDQSAVVAKGYLKGTVSKVAKALREGWRPDGDGADKASKKGTGTNAPPIAIPKAGLVVFTIGQESVPISSQDLQQCYDEYRDMRDLISWESDFSSTLREGIKMYRGAMCRMLGGNENG